MHVRLARPVLVVASMLICLIPAGTALAAPLGGTAHAVARPDARIAAAPAAAATCGSDPKLNGVDELSAGARREPKGPVNNFIELWYSPTCRYAWAVEENGAAGDSLWVYNEDSKATASASVQTTGTRTVTAAVDDAHTKSHACMENTSPVFPPQLPKTCTGYF